MSMTRICWIRRAPRGVGGTPLQEVQRNCLGNPRYTQRLGSDPIGFGDLVRAKYYSAWKTMDWEEVYRDATVNVEVKWRSGSSG